MNWYKYQISSRFVEEGNWQRHEEACRSLSKKRIYVIYAILTTCFFVQILDSTMERPILPNVLSYFDSLDQNGNVVMLTYLVGSIAQPFWAKFSDLLGRRGAMISGFCLYILGNILNCAAWNFNSYAAGIGISAFGSNGVAVMIKCIIADIFPASVRGYWGSYYEALKVIFSFAGPYIGEAILNLNWRVMYTILIGLGVCCIIPVAIVIKLPAPFEFSKSKDKKLIPVKAAIFMDLGGLCLLSAGAGCLLVAIKYGGVNWAWDSAESITFFVMAPVIILILIGYEKCIAAPGCKIMSSNLILNRNAMGACLTSIIGSIASQAYNSYQSQYLQVVSNYDPSDAGMLNGYKDLCSVAAMISVGWLMRITGKWRIWGFIGIGVNYIGMGMYLGLNRDTQYWYNVVINCVLGAAGGIMKNPCFIVAQDSVRKENRATIVAVYGFFRYFGSALGAQIAAASWTNLLNGKIADAHWVTPNINTDKMKNDINYITCKKGASPCLDAADWEQLKGLYEDTWEVLAYYSLGIYVLVIGAYLIMGKHDLKKNEKYYKGWKKKDEAEEDERKSSITTAVDSTYSYEYSYESKSDEQDKGVSVKAITEIAVIESR